MDSTMQKLLEIHGSYSAICSKTSVQCCHCCERLYCGDNLNPINPYLKLDGWERVERFSLMTIEEAESIQKQDSSLLKRLLKSELMLKTDDISDVNIPGFFISRLKRICKER